MANIVSSLFGVSPTELQAQKDMAFQQSNALFSQLNPSQQAVYMAGNLGYGAGKLGGQLFGIEDPMLKQAKMTEEVLANVTSSLSPEDISNPNIVYPALAKAFQEKGLGKQATLAIQQGMEEIPIYNKQINDAKKTNLELENQAKFKQEVASIYAEGRQPTQEELLSLSAKYTSPEKLFTTLQTSQDKEAYRTAMLDQARIAAESRLDAAIQRGADAKEIANIKGEISTKLAELKAATGSGGKSGVYERLYGQQTVTSARELVPASLNLNILTKGGESPVTAGIFRDMGANGFLSASGKVLGNTLTPAASAQYESIMLPIINNIGTLQNGGRRPTVNQTDILKKALIAEPGQPIIVQLQKMGELRQIVEAAVEAADVNPALTEEQMTLVKDSLAKLQESIPFTGSDVASFSMAAKNNPNLTFKDWMTNLKEVKFTPVGNKELTKEQLKLVESAMQAVSNASWPKEQAIKELKKRGIEVK